MIMKFILSFFLLSAVATQADATQIEAVMEDVKIHKAVNSGAIATLAPPTNKSGLTQTECLAVAVYHEARGEILLGQIAVASVVLRRVEVGRHWGRKVCDILRPNQLSFMTSNTTFNPIKDLDAWAQSLAVAQVMMNLGPLTELRNADHYHTTAVNPVWNKAMPVVASIGVHLFYADPLSMR
jgi:spore germination cell wall hydrolase CwlJ-like protein